MNRVAFRKKKSENPNRSSTSIESRVDEEEFKPTPLTEEPAVRHVGNNGVWQRDQTLQGEVERPFFCRVSAKVTTQPY